MIIFNIKWTAEITTSGRKFGCLSLKIDYSFKITPGLVITQKSCMSQNLLRKKNTAPISKHAIFLGGSFYQCIGFLSYQLLSVVELFWVCKITMTFISIVFQTSSINTLINLLKPNKTFGARTYLKEIFSKLIKIFFCKSVHTHF